MFAALCLVAVVLVGLTHWVYRWRNPKCKGSLPPGSMGFPLIGESLEFFTLQPFEGVPAFVKKRVARYGKLFKTSLVGQSVVVSNDPDINQYVFKNEGTLFQCYYTESAAQLLGKQAMSAQIGVMHKYLRNLAFRLVGPATIKGSLMNEMDRITQEHLHLWTTNRDIDVKKAAEKMIFTVTAQNLLQCPKEEVPKLMKEYKNFGSGFISFPLNIPGTAYHAALKGRRNAIETIKKTFHKRRSSTTRNDNDFLDHLLQEMDNEEAPLNEAIALDLAFLLLYAAYETTATAITFALKFLSENPEALKQLMEEHEEMIRKRESKDLTFTWTEYKSMTFTHMVINETVRVGNIAGVIIRKVKEDVQLKGYTVPAGWTLIVCPPSIHFDSKNYEDPYVFNPWRWNEQELHSGSRKFIAFGGGSRLCAGADFSKVQVAIFLHHLVTKYTWKVTQEANIFRNPGPVFKKGLRIKINEKQGEGDHTNINA